MRAARSRVLVAVSNLRWGSLGPSAAACLVLWRGDAVWVRVGGWGVRGWPGVEALRAIGCVPVCGWVPGSGLAGEAGARVGWIVAEEELGGGGGVFLAADPAVLVGVQALEGGQCCLAVRDRCAVKGCQVLGLLDESVAVGVQGLGYQALQVGQLLVVVGLRVAAAGDHGLCELGPADPPVAVGVAVCAQLLPPGGVAVQDRRGLRAPGDAQLL